MDATEIREWLGTAAAVVGACIAALYGMGFVIVQLHLGRLGYLGLEELRGSYFISGLLWLLISAPPFILVAVVQSARAAGRRTQAEDALTVAISTLWLLLLILAAARHAMTVSSLGWLLGYLLVIGFFSYWWASPRPAGDPQGPDTPRRVTGLWARGALLLGVSLTWYSLAVSTAFPAAYGGTRPQDVCLLLTGPDVLPAGMQAETNGKGRVELQCQLFHETKDVYVVACAASGAPCVFGVPRSAVASVYYGVWASGTRDCPRSGDRCAPPELPSRWSASSRTEHVQSERR